MDKQGSKHGLEYLELEYSFDQYFSASIDPIIKKQTQELRSRQERETRQRGNGWGGFVDAASPFTSTTVKKESGEWNRKTTEDLMKMIDRRLGNNTTIQNNLEEYTTSWREAIIKEYGAEQYKKMSEKCPSKDLAKEIVSERLSQGIIESLAKNRVPKSSFEYIIKKGLGESLPFFLNSMNHPKTKTDTLLDKLAEKMYNPTLAERSAATGVSLLTDSAISGGSSWIMRPAAMIRGVRTYAETANYRDGQQENPIGNSQTMAMINKYQNTNKKPEIKTIPELAGIRSPLDLLSGKIKSREEIVEEIKKNVLNTQQQKQENPSKTEKSSISYKVNGKVFTVNATQQQVDQYNALENSKRSKFFGRVLKSNNPQQYSEFQKAIMISSADRDLRTKTNVSWNADGTPRGQTENSHAWNKGELCSKPSFLAQNAFDQIYQDNNKQESKVGLGR